MKTVLSAVVLLLFAGIACQAEPIQIEKTGITFEAPKGFKPLSKSIMALKWRRGNPPKFAVGNEKATTTVAYDLKPHAIPQDKMDEIKTSFTKLFGRLIPGIKWIEQKVIEKEGQKWLFLELTSNAVDTDIHNIMLITGYKDKMLIFNFNSTKQDFPVYEKELRKSISSIRLPK
ncbi:MAG: hypothetical protein ACRBBN_07170 [Methyloligellaceae bacterium]